MAITEILPVGTRVVVNQDTWAGYVAGDTGTVAETHSPSVEFPWVEMDVLKGNYKKWCPHISWIDVIDLTPKLYDVIPQ